MGPDAEHLLTEGATPGVVRVGDTVRRPPHDRSLYVRSVLRHLESVGFDGAPRVLGTDQDGREILSFIAGDVVREPAQLSDARLRSVAGLIRRFHDATAGTALARGAEVVCHGDLGPHNTVFDGDRAVGLIDWDVYVAPGPRLHDLGHAVWCYADIGAEGGPVALQARRARLICEAYGWDDPDAVIDEITDRFRRARAQHRAAGRDKAVGIFSELITWMQLHAAELKSQL
jgi:aminoglycoside phosphotransferase (APT) family kinase protein